MNRPSDRDMFGELPVQRRPAPPFEDRWPNDKVAQITVMIMRGMSCPAIAAELADGTTSNDINKMIVHWGIKPPGGRRNLPVKVMLSARDRTLLHHHAQKRGIDMGELARRIIHTMNIHQSLYTNVLEDGIDE